MKVGWNRANVIGSSMFELLLWIKAILDFMNLSKLWEIVMDRGAWCVVVHGVSESEMT